jgi:hypothetical protein
MSDRQRGNDAWSKSGSDPAKNAIHPRIEPVSSEQQIFELGVGVHAAMLGRETSQSVSAFRVIATSRSAKGRKGDNHRRIRQAGRYLAPLPSSPGR